MTPTFRPYDSRDYQPCLALFDLNCPEFFAPNERGDYEQFLTEMPQGYEICELDRRIAGVFGLIGDGTEKRLNWIMLHPDVQGAGIGTAIMHRVRELGLQSDTKRIHISASHLSEPFFAKFGAQTTSTITDGWGPGMHQVHMVLQIAPSGRE